MNHLHLDMHAGISGDMFLGACLEIGLELSEIREAVHLLGFPTANIVSEKVNKHEIQATQFSSGLDGSKEHHHRSYPDIIELINGSRLPDPVKQTASHIFTILGIAEADIHGIDLQEVHFHEVGAVDSIIDITGAAVAFQALNRPTITHSPIRLGQGEVKCQHGTYPLPAPATLKILAGREIQLVPEMGESVTPTGAAILAGLDAQPADRVDGKIISIGYGAGQRDTPGRPNVLRAILLNSKSKTSGNRDTVIQSEINLDDQSPEQLGYLAEKLLKEGALEVWFTAAQMKKFRPGSVLHVLGRPHDQDKLHAIIFAESTTLGIRSWAADRIILQRRSTTANTSLGSVKVKEFSADGKCWRSKPEYESCKKIAKQKKMPLQEVYRIVEKELAAEK